ncbi:MAG: DUF2635 domain-containing protein [Alphaproteobacteria bacterium]|nr:DUF2635 domain-containing protein [Alphaproteobacteria bacterium]
MFVKPNPNKKVGGQKLKVFDPARREFLPDAGRDVPKTPYWQRRLNVGDVVPAEPAKAPAKTAKPEKPANSPAPAKKAAAKKQSGAKKNSKAKSEAAKAPENSATEEKKE